MSDLMEEDTDISESELDEYADSCFEKLKQGDEVVKVSENDYKCPYCRGKRAKIFRFKDLSQHATAIGEVYTKRNHNDRGKHLGLLKYLQTVVNVKSSSSECEMVTDEGEMVTKERYGNENSDELIVRPWMGVVANVPVQWQNGRYVGESGSKFRDELTIKGFNPLRVHPLWNYKGHSGYAIVEFRTDWSGFADAIRFEKEYEARHQGKLDYVGVEEKGDKLYCWVAREDDYRLKNVIGDHLRKNGDLRTVADYQEEVERKNKKLVSKLADTIEVKDKIIKEIETKFKETSTSLIKLVDQKDEMIRTFNEERNRVQQNAREHLEQIVKGHERMTLNLEEKRSELKRLEMELEKREAHNEKKRLMIKQEQNERAILEQKRADENILKLGADHKREQQELNRKVIELEKQLDAKQALELEIQRLRGNMRAAKHMENAGDENGPKKLSELEEELKDKEEQLESIEALNQTLIIKDNKCKDELDGARKELINGFLGQSSRASIGVKILGELDSKAFLAAAKKKHPKEADVMAATLCSLWESYIKDPNWNPFKDGNGGSKETIVNDKDAKLMRLRSEYGEEPYQAVIAALREMMEHKLYDQNGRYSAPELWNCKDEKIATTKEGILFLMKQWSLLKKKRRY